MVAHVMYAENVIYEKNVIYAVGPHARLNEIAGREARR
jgi:hypothetical protein